MDIVKCRNCGNDIDKNVAYKVGKASYYCNENCYSIKMKKRNVNKKKYEPKENTTRRSLTDYIQKIYMDNGYDKSEINWTLICSQIKNILDNHDIWSYDTLQYILYYMYEIEEVNLFDEKSNDSILSLVPFYGLKAEQYYNQMSSVAESIENFEFQDNTRIVKKSLSNKKSKFKQIDLTNL